MVRHLFNSRPNPHEAKGPYSQDTKLGHGKPLFKIEDEPGIPHCLGNPSKTHWHFDIFETVHDVGAVRFFTNQSPPPAFFQVANRGPHCRWSRRPGSPDDPFMAKTLNVETRFLMFCRTTMAPKKWMPLFVERHCPPKWQCRQI